jgi:hypothetical protein
MPGPTITAPRPATALVPPSLLLEHLEPGVATDHCSTGPVTITVARPLPNWLPSRLPEAGAFLVVRCRVEDGPLPQGLEKKGLRKSMNFISSTLSIHSSGPPPSDCSGCFCSPTRASCSDVK